MKILITGGTGSIGEGVLRVLLEDPKISEVIVLSRDEFKQCQLRAAIKSPKLRCVLGDIRDRASLIGPFRGVDVVFHAAALKHVDLGELMPEEFVKTNILGSMNVFDVAEEVGVKKVILLSTDKAAHATSVLGMTKGIAERLMIAHAHNNSKTTFCAVRLGNVLVSRGSVVPIFVEAIKNRGVIAITDPKMTRFVLSLSECSEFIKFALEPGKQGDIFIKKCNVMEIGILARAILGIFKSDIPIKIIGRREGERVHEILANQTELSQSEDMDGYYRISNLLDKDISVKSSTINEDYSSETTRPLTLEETTKALLALDYIQNEIKETF